MNCSTAYCRSVGVVVILVTFIPHRGSAQAVGTPPPRVELRASRATSIHLDGKLDEKEWSTAEAATNFTQRFPDPGHPATMRTEVRILYDANAIYIGARMFDPHPDSITAPLARRDPGDVNSDWIDVIFDSYNDRRTGYRFGVNPAGTKLDVYHFNDSDDDSSWDALWEVATSIDSLGWTAEYRIPLSQLRFHRSTDEQMWGLNFYRAVARRDEWTFWSPTPPSAPGFVSLFGTLRGLVGLNPPSPMEISPYISSKVSTRPATPGNQDAWRQQLGTQAGADFRVGLGSSLSVTGTVNPDFGQVEVDPAVIRLSEVETFLPEKRPFFLEGAGIFQFGSLPVDAPLSFSRFVHWRRIGRAPQIVAQSPSTDTPGQTTILGAAKLSGQLPHGISVGVVDAVTQKEVVANQVIEPYTNYFVGRLKQDLNDGHTTLGLIGTSTERSLSDATANLLRSGAYLLGIDATTASANRHWTAGGFFAQSRVVGSQSAIAATQLSSVHYFQRPDQAYARFDPTRTSLDGHDAETALIYQGNPWFGSAELRETSPGYEVNDLGYLSRADTRSATASVGGIRNTSQGPLRSTRAQIYTQNAWNFGGDAIYRRVGFASSAELSSFWYVSLRGALRASVFSDKHTRGGPLIRLPGTRAVGGSVTTDGRRSVIGSVDVYYEDKGENGPESIVSTSLKFRPTPALDISVAPTFSRLTDNTQYVRTVTDSLATSTFGQHYVFATLRQNTVSVDTRVNWTLSPTLSFQLFTQPFVSTTEFAGYKELRAPGTYNFNRYGVDKGTLVRDSSGVIQIDPDGIGASAPFTIAAGSGQTNFLARALRANAVVRWEYRSGSALFVVWQQERDANDPLNETDSGIARVLSLPARNTIVVKATYRIGR